MAVPGDVRDVHGLKEREAPPTRTASTIESSELLLNYDVRPFVQRILDTPTLMIVAEEDDLTLWDLEIEAYNAIPTTEEAPRGRRPTRRT